MPLFIAALIGALVQAAGTLVGKILLSLGIGYATYTGIDASITWARDFAIAKLAATGGTVVQMAGVMQVGTSISIVTSALAARMVLNGLTSGTLRKFTVKG